MSDSDSDYENLISKAEHNFWQCYADEAPNDSSPEAPSTSSASRITRSKTSSANESASSIITPAKRKNTAEVSPKRMRMKKATSQREKPAVSPWGDEAPFECTAGRSKTPPMNYPDIEYWNAAIKIRVVWKSIHEMTFRIRRFTPLKRIVEHIAAKENVAPDHIYFFIRNKLIDLNAHSCVTLNYWPTSGAIEGGVLDEEIQRDKPTIGIQLTLQHQRQVRILTMDPLCILSKLYAQVVIAFNLHIRTFKLKFDGCILDYWKLAADYDIIEGDCIDVIRCA